MWDLGFRAQWRNGSHILACKSTCMAGGLRGVGDSVFPPSKVS